LKNGILAMAEEEVVGYVLSPPGVSTFIIGCNTPAEVDEDTRLARSSRCLVTTGTGTG
jgi:predicted aldo/keto reductase-like oxidoreductase